jgi:uncharacterized protein DUF1800
MSVTPSDLGLHGAVYLLDRLGYGPRPGQAREILDQGLDRWARDQLSPGPDPELDTRLAPLTTLGFSVSQVLDLYARDQSSTGVILDQLALAKILRAVHGKNQLGRRNRQRLPRLGGRGLTVRRGGHAQAA